MSKDNRKPLFAVIGEIGETTVTTDRGTYKRHTFIPASQPYMRDRLNKIPVKKKVQVTFSEEVTTRSEQQLAYHFVLCTLIGEYTGDTPEEIHDFVMRLKFGVKKIKIGKIEQEVRKSISKGAKMPKYRAVELINFDLKICKFLKINVPTRRELGYEDLEVKIDNKDFHKGLEVPEGEVKF